MAIEVSREKETDTLMDRYLLGLGRVILESAWRGELNGIGSIDVSAFLYRSAGRKKLIPHQADIR